MTQPQPPVAPKRPHQHVEHGVVREDPWFWLRDRADPAVLAHLEAENRWTEERLAPLEPVRKALYDEFLGRLQQTDRSVGHPSGPWVYYHRTVEGRSYPVYCRQPRGGGDEQVLLDVNLLAEGNAFTSVAGVQVSPDHGTLAFATDFTGDEKYTLRFRDLATGIDLPDTLQNTNGRVAWASDSRTLLFCDLDQALRSYRALRYTLGAGEGPAVVLHEPDEGLWVGVHRSRSGALLFVRVHNHGTSEMRLIPADRPTEPPEVVFPRRDGVKFTVEHAGDSLFVLTNTGDDGVPGSAVNQRLLERPIGGGPVVERIAHRADVELADLDGFADHLVVTERVSGQLGLRILDLRAATDRIATLPESPCLVYVDETPEYAGGVVRFRYLSLTTPVSDYDLDLSTLALKRLKEQPVPGYERTRYRTERLEATAPDGTRVPMSVVYRSDMDLRAGPHPTVLHGYGAYGITLDPMFSGPRVSLLDRGVVFVIAHVRGGGYLGRSWYEAGKLANKGNTFADFVACARRLIALGVTAPDRLLAQGGSAGGLLVGAVMNLAPELFCAVQAAVPFVDVLSTMLDLTLPLTIPEFQEFGDPRQRDVFDRMLGYTPYDNVREVRYPNLLATAGWSDPRVSYWEPAKWVARLRERATGGEFLLKTQLGAGHQGPSGRYGALEERAFETAWLLRELGVDGLREGEVGSDTP